MFEIAESNQQDFAGGKESQQYKCLQDESREVLARTESPLLLRPSPAAGTFWYRAMGCLVRTSANPSSIVPDPELSQPIGGRIQQPYQPPQPVIGKLPEGYEPPKDRVVGAQPKDESRNYKYKSPIKTDAAIDRVIQAGLASTVTISQSDLLAIAPEYHRRMKDSVTSCRVGLNAETNSNSWVVEDPVKSFLPQNPHVNVFNTVIVRDISM
ncbi:hypothetical protein PQX77_016157, partial [Marasmius sp. AFHP31]